LATTPLRSIGRHPSFGPVKQYTEEKIEAPITLVVYPGSDGEFTCMKMMAAPLIFGAENGKERD
jgi:hypothetical protein